MIAAKSRVKWERILFGKCKKDLSHMKPDLADRLRLQGLEFRLLHAPSESKAVAQQWGDTFVGGLKAEAAMAAYGRYRWQVFSFDLVPCVAGEVARSMYLNQWQVDFIVFDESLDFCARCPAQPYPDFSALGLDLYVSHHHMKWTMAFTHEQPHLGPYFAQRPTR